VVDQFLNLLDGALESIEPMRTPRKPAGMPNTPAAMGLMANHSLAATPPKKS